MPRTHNPIAARPYTVLLLYPDYLASDYGHETYLAHVHAHTTEAAIRFAQNEVASAGDNGLDSAPDFHVLAVFAGHQIDIADL